MFRKRKSSAAPEPVADTTLAAKKPCLNVAGDGSAREPVADTTSAANNLRLNGVGDVVSVASPENKSDDESADDKQAVRNATMIVRLPTRAPNAPLNNVIVIDDSDDDDETYAPRDVKPDRQQLDEQLAEHSATSDADTVHHTPPPPTTATTDHTNHIKNERAASDRTSAENSCETSAGQAVDGAGVGDTQAHSSSHSDAENVQPVMQPDDPDYSHSSRPQNRSSKSTASSATRLQKRRAVDKPSGKTSTSDRLVQTESTAQDAGIQTEDCSSSAEQKLESLRNNVLQLLKTIVPTLTCNNLEFVDELVVEMVRVNAEVSEIDE